MSKERLVELMSTIPCDNKKCGYECNGKCVGDFDWSCQKKALAEHFIANGVIVPTYNIGQTVYAVTKGDDLWWKGTVASICCEFNEMSYGIMFDDGDFAMFEEECVFPTRKEAEAKLKEEDEGK